MKRFNPGLTRVLTLLLLLTLLTSVVSAAPLSEQMLASEAVKIPEEAGNAELMLGINAGLLEMYKKYYTTDDGFILPDYFAGCYTGEDGLLVMGLTEISDEILEEVRTAIYSYRSVGETKVSDVEYLDKWFPTISYQLMEYSYNQMHELCNALRAMLRDEKKTESYVRMDVENNRVILFYEDEETLISALDVAGNDIAMIHSLPSDQFDAWLETSTAWLKARLASGTQTPDSEVELETAEAAAAGSIMPGMQNVFYNANHSMSSGTVGFTAFLTYYGSNNNDFGFQWGDSVAAFFTHGHDISNTYPYSSVQNIYSADLLYHNTTVDYSFYLPRNGTGISGKRFGSTAYFDEFCESEGDIYFYLEQWSAYPNVYFYGRTSGEESFSSGGLNVGTGTVYWSDSSAVSQPGDSGGPIYFSYTANGVTRLILIAIVSTSNVYTGGTGQTIYSIINDLENNTDYSFDNLCTN